MAYSSTLLLFLWSVYLMALVNAKHCRSGQFLEHKSRECRPCADCPANQIVREPCLPHKDTICGPFYEFEHFNVGNQGSVEKDNHETRAKDIKWKADNNEEFEAMLRSYFMKDPFKFNSHTQTEEEEVSQPQTKTHTGPSMQSTESTWRELCFGLIGALVAVSALSLLYIVLVCLRARNRAGPKLVSMIDPEDPTVQYHTEVSASEHLPKGTEPSHSLRHIESQLASNKGQGMLRRFLKVSQGNDYVTEVFEVKKPVVARVHLPHPHPHPQAADPCIPHHLYSPPEVLRSGSETSAHSTGEGDTISLSISVPAPDEDLEEGVGFTRQTGVACRKS